MAYYNEDTYKASKKYKKENIKRVPLDMQVSDYDVLKAVADSCGEKVNEYIKKAIKQRMDRECTAKDITGAGFGILRDPAVDHSNKLPDPNTDK